MAPPAIENAIVALNKNDCAGFAKNIFRILPDPKSTENRFFFAGFVRQTA
jgi:hypothetical protein